MAACASKVHECILAMKWVMGSVPRYTQQPLPPQLPDNAGLHPFFTAVKRGPNDGPWVVYPNERDLYTRTEHYPPLYDLHVMPSLTAAHRSWTAKESRVSANFLVLGPPGIGKSMSINFLLMRALRQFPEVPVVTLCVEHVDFFVPDGCGSHKRYTVLREDLGTASTFLNFMASLGVTAAPIGDYSRPPLLVLHDIKTEQSPQPPLHLQLRLMGVLAVRFSLVLVVFSSPSGTNYRAYEKFPASNSGTPTKYWMPLWSKNEMNCCKLLPDSPPCSKQQGGGGCRGQDD